MESSWLRAVLRAWVALVLAFLFIPIVLIVLYAFNQSNIESWPIAGFSLHWYSVAWHDSQVRSAFLLSVRVGLVATALVSGALLAFALSFDEVIVTVFTAGAQNTLPLWIFGAIRLGQQLPEVNAVVTVVILLTLIPVILAARVAGAGALSRTARTAEVAEG